jgi:putative addiction module component (TIGR02574 family)
MSTVMSAATKLKQINNYLTQLNDKQITAVLTVVKTFAEEQENDVWQDKAFIAELDRRTAEYESGKTKVLTLDQLESRVRKAYKTKAKAKR